MAFRKILFWTHLTAGVVAGLVILIMSLTGVLIVFEPQIIDIAERDIRNVPPPGPDSKRLDMGAIVTKARQEVPNRPVSGLILRSEPTASVAVNFGRDVAVFINPYTGDVLGKNSTTGKALHQIEDWHRWLGSRDIGKPITGICNAAFLILVVTGSYLWWPRQMTGATFKNIIFFNRRLQGKASIWNRHNVIGFWCAPVIFVLTLTGLIMSYPWANNLLYTLTGNKPPPPQSQAAGSPREASQVRLPEADMDVLVANAEQQLPGWVSITLRFPQKPDAPVTASILEPPVGHPNPRSQLTLDPATGKVVKWEPFSNSNLGRKLRGWVRPLHTGEAGGVMGQIIALLGSAGGVILVWTGLSMARVRFFQRKSKPFAAPADRTTESRYFNR